MAPTLRTGDRVLVLCYWPLIWLRHNQIVLSEVKDAVALPPKMKRHLEKTLFIKRIVGLPDETMEVQLSELPETWREHKSEKYNRG